MASDLQGDLGPPETFTERVPSPPALDLQYINALSDCVVSGVGDDLKTGGRVLPR